MEFQSAGIDNKSTLHTLSMQWVCVFTTSMFSLYSTLKYNNAIHVPAVVSCRVQNCGERGRFHRSHRDCNFNVARWASTICYTQRQPTAIVKLHHALLPPIERLCLCPHSHIYYRLAVAMTINKVQGQIFDQVGLYLPIPVFTHGLLYVAMSRVRTLSSIKILIDPRIANVRNHAGAFTSNVVYPEILLHNT